MIEKEGIPAGYHRRKTMTYEQVKQDEAVRVYIDQADASLKALGFIGTQLPACDTGRSDGRMDSGNAGLSGENRGAGENRRISPRYRQRCESGRSQPERRGDGVPDSGQNELSAGGNCRHRHGHRQPRRRAPASR